MLNILGICTRLCTTEGDLDCLGENGLYPQEVGTAGVFPINSKQLYEPRIRAMKQVDELKENLKIPPFSHLESYLMVLKADPSPILR